MAPPAIEPSIPADASTLANDLLHTHVLLWIVEDAEAWARAVEADGDAEPGRWPTRQRHIGEHRRAERHASAEQIRAEGPRRSWYALFHDADSATAVVADLYRSHPNPGVRYEIAPITAQGACPTCQQPTIEADGQWRHHLGGFPVDCLVSPDSESERADGEFEITIPGGPMVCGYCGTAASWPHVVLGYAALTGFHALGVGPGGELVVLVEAVRLDGTVQYLPHLCTTIPDGVYAEHADDIAAIVQATNTSDDARDIAEGCLTELDSAVSTNG